MPPERRRSDQPAVPQIVEESPIEDMPLGCRVAGGVKLRDQDVPRDESGRRRPDAVGATPFGAGGRRILFGRGLVTTEQAVGEAEEESDASIF